MKFREKVCGHCGSDLTTAEAIGAREALVGGEKVFLGQCPKCHTYRIMVAPEPEVVEPVAEPMPEPEPPTSRGGRRRASEPEPEPVVEPKPPEE